MSSKLEWLANLFTTHHSDMVGSLSTTLTALDCSKECYIQTMQSVHPLNLLGITDMPDVLSTRLEQFDPNLYLHVPTLAASYSVVRVREMANKDYLMNREIIDLAKSNPEVYGALTQWLEDKSDFVLLDKGVRFMKSGHKVCVYANKALIGTLAPKEATRFREGLITGEPTIVTLVRNSEKPMHMVIANDCLTIYDGVECVTLKLTVDEGIELIEYLGG